MAEYIEREAVLSKLLEYGIGWGAAKVKGVIQSIPSADVAPVRRGRWELDVLDGTPGYRPVCIVCSECHRISYAGFPFCPNCGARMDGES